jgi:hypothetical protein
MNDPVEILKYQGKYPIKMKRVLLGESMEGESHYEKRLFMYLGAIRLDVSDYNPDQVKLIVTKLELMGIAHV